MSKAATIRRGGRRQPSRLATGKGRARARGAMARVVAAMPFSQDVVDRLAMLAAGTMVAAALVAGILFSGLPSYVGREVALLIGRAGFEVKRVEVTGIDRMERLTVYAIALDQHSMAMPLVDLDKIRGQLLQYGWIEDARVSRRLPDTLVVDIVERKPAAIWQHNRTLTLIDAKGVILEPVDLNAMPDLPLLIGRNANRESQALAALIARAPALKPMVASATWVGNRRWDLQFHSGETLALPEGEEAAGRALTRFARMEGVQRLLGRGFIRFDMRDPTKFVARIDRSKPSIDKPARGAGNEEKGEVQGGAA